MTMYQSHPKRVGIPFMIFLHPDFRRADVPQKKRRLYYTIKPGKRKVAQKKNEKNVFQT